MTENHYPHPRSSQKRNYSNGNNDHYHDQNKENIPELERLLDYACTPDPGLGAYRDLQQGDGVDSEEQRDDTGDTDSELDAAVSSSDLASSCSFILILFYAVAVAALLFLILLMCILGSGNDNGTVVWLGKAQKQYPSFNYSETSTLMQDIQLTAAASGIVHVDPSSVVSEHPTPTAGDASVAASGSIGFSTLQNCISSLSLSPASSRAPLNRIRVAIFVSSVNGDTSHLPPPVLQLVSLQQPWCIVYMRNREAMLDRSVINASIRLYRRYQHRLKQRLTGFNHSLIQQRVAVVTPSQLSFLSSIFSFGSTSSQKQGPSFSRNLAYLIAIRAGATIIYDGDVNYMYTPETAASGTTDLPIDFVASSYSTPTYFQFQHYTQGSTHVYSWNSDVVFLQPQLSVVTPAAADRYRRFLGGNEKDNVEEGIPWVSCFAPIQHMQTTMPTSTNTYPRYAVNQGVYTSYSTSSTLYLLPAFFSLFLPPKDEWRSLIAQTLLTYVRLPTHPYLDHPDDSVHTQLDLTPNDRLSQWYGRAEYMIRDVHSLEQPNIESCLSVSTGHVTPINNEAKTETLDLVEQENHNKIRAFLTQRLRGHEKDLQLRLRKQRHEAEQQHRASRQNRIDVTTDIADMDSSTITDLLVLLYNDMQEDGWIGQDVLVEVKAWAADLHRIVNPALQTTKPQASLNPAAAASPSLLFPGLPYRQTRFPVCVNFNFPPRDSRLWLNLRYFSFLHESWLMTVPIAITSLTAIQQFWINHSNANVVFIKEEQQFYGYCQQFTLLACLEYWKGHKQEQHQGVLYTSDDLYFDFHAVLHPGHRDPSAPLTLTSSDPQTAFLTYPLDEFWYPLPLMLYNMKDPRKWLGDWGWMKEHNYFPMLRDQYWGIPQHWRDLMNEWIGKPDAMPTNAVADLVYVPYGYRQLEILITVIKTFNAVAVEKKHTECQFSEVLWTPLFHFTMLLANHSPIILLPSRGENYDHVYETTFPSRDLSTYYKQLLTFINDYSSKHSLDPRTWRIRPVPLSWAGYAWDRGNEPFMDWLMNKQERQGDPPYVHPVKMERLLSPQSRAWEIGYERQIQQFNADRYNYQDQ